MVLPGLPVIDPLQRRRATVLGADDPTGFGGVTAFRRDPSTGLPTQLPGTAGCMGSWRSDAAPCSNAPFDVFFDARAIAGAHDSVLRGRRRGLAAARCDPGSGGLDLLEGSTGCVETSGAVDQARRHDGSLGENGKATPEGSPGECKDGRGVADEQKFGQVSGATAA